MSQFTKGFLNIFIGILISSTLSPFDCLDNSHRGFVSHENWKWFEDVLVNKPNILMLLNTR
jgi:hypothetical protein